MTMPEAKRLDAMLTRLKLTAILDRLLHHSLVITIRGGSYRLLA